MFTAYFDAGGDSHSQRLLALGGFVAHSEAWMNWEKEWYARLKADKLTLLHIKELYKMEKAAKSRLLNDLSEITRNYVANKFGVVVYNAELTANVTEKDRRRWRIQAYALAARTAARAVRLWAESWGGRMPELVFEDGDKGKGDFMYAMERDGYPSPIFKPKRSYVHKKSGILIDSAGPLQAADLLSYNLFSLCRDSFKTGRVENLTRALHLIPGECGCVEYERYRLIKQGLEQGDSLVMVTDVKIQAP